MLSSVRRARRESNVLVLPSPWVVLAVCISLAVSAPAPAAQAGLPGSLEAVEGIFDADEAWDVLEAIDPYFRMRGNDGYLRSVQKIFLHLKDAGFSEGSALEQLDTLEIRDFGPVRPAWTPLRASFSVTTPAVGKLHGFDDEAGLERTFVAVNSFPTGEAGIDAPLMRYERSKPPESYAGTIVVGDEPAETLFRRSVQEGGALGCISSYLGDYNRPDENRDAIRYCQIPYDEERRGFALNVSPNKYQVLDRLVDTGSVWAHVHIDARFTDARSRTLIARIGGTQPSAGTIAFVAHLDEPGANDNGSGVATMAAMASGYLRAIREGRVERPRRSLTFLWGTEFECSREWLASRPGPVDMALVIDMVGEDLQLTRAEPLVERIPDPGAIWDRRPLDVHSEWGRGDVRESDLHGTFVNDYVMAAMNIRRDATDWPVRSNPYEGGSDHESFLARGIPSVLLWHFTDIYYHTNLDRLDKVDRQEMVHVAVTTLALAHHFGMAGAERAQEVLDIVLEAARVRLAVEAENARAFLSPEVVRENPAQFDRVMQRERRIILAWSRWYREALLSVVNFEPDTLSPERLPLEERIDAALTELRQVEHEILEQL